MKVVAFNGSPRKGGNTEILIKKVFEPLAAAGIETELVQVGGKPIRGCISCGKCWERKDRKCALTEDIINDCIAKIIDADGIILGSPTYFADVSSEMKGLIDRSGMVLMANGGLLRRKVGAGVIAVRRGGATHVLDTISHYFQISQMVIACGTYWNMGYGRDVGEVLEDEEGLRNMTALGENIAWLLKAIEKAGR
jgi:multimeric flavodoxin WrbA